MGFSGILWFLMSLFVVDSWQVSKVSLVEFSQLRKFRPRDHFRKWCELYSMDSKITTHLYVGSIIEDQIHSELRLVGRVESMRKIL